MAQELKEANISRAVEYLQWHSASAPCRQCDTQGQAVAGKTSHTRKLQKRAWKGCAQSHAPGRAEVRPQSPCSGLGSVSLDVDPLGKLRSLALMFFDLDLFLTFGLTVVVYCFLFCLLL